MSLQSNIKSRYYFWNIYRVFRKNCVCSQFTATPPSPASLCCKRFSKLSNAMRVYSHSYWLVISCTTNSSRVLARERWQTFEKHPVFQFVSNLLFGLNLHEISQTYGLFTKPNTKFLRNFAIHPFQFLQLYRKRLRDIR